MRRVSIGFGPKPENSGNTIAPIFRIAEKGDEGFRKVRHVDGDDVAPGNAKSDKRLRDAANIVREVAIRQCTTLAHVFAAGLIAVLTSQKMPLNPLK